MEQQRQQLLQERQQFHLEQLRAAEFRQRQFAAQQLVSEGKLTIPQINNPPQQQQQTPPQQQHQPQQTATSSTFASSSSTNTPTPPIMITANAPLPASQAVASPVSNIVSVQQQCPQSDQSQQQAAAVQQPQQQQRPPSAQPPSVPQQTTDSTGT